MNYKGEIENLIKNQAFLFNEENLRNKLRKYYASFVSKKKLLPGLKTHRLVLLVLL